MPELPEVEVTRRSIAGRIAGAQIHGVLLGGVLRWPLNCAPEDLLGHRVQAVRRRGKYLLLDLDVGVLLIHLGMSGRLSFAHQPSSELDKLDKLGKHEHFALQTSLGTLRLKDPRRFGAVVYAQSEQDAVIRKLLGRLGPEPLGADFDLQAFQVALARSKAAIKPGLLSGKLVVGVGNIYACEVLFQAGIHPETRCCDLDHLRMERLHQAIRAVLERAIQRGGSTLRDFSDAQGQAGHFQLETMVYARAGQPCRVCASTVCVIRQGQRSSFFCPACQKP
ncbi:MAG: bifunctional DNA-formamidopyrimidine glycosylase/DNA-(apurinic or apyrimidinic site) lyase [Rhodoferax sp.]|nr:bifunctional DNA-formamidopyrimidine glycosylase/DNA-(apurinic or apyrimidinic site) lyase [Rhodoferax sp.]